MLDVVEVRTPLGALLSLPLEDPTGGYFIDKIDGLDPGKASLVSVPYAQADGSLYRSSRREPRNIVISLTFEPDYAVESMQSLRDRLYSFFMPESQVSLRFKMSTTPGGAQIVRDIQGRVEDCSVELFTEKPTASISIMCFDPDFVDPVPVQLNGVGTSSGNFAEIPFTYKGTVPTGFKLTFTETALAYTVTPYFRSPGNIVRAMELTYSFNVNDVVTLSTVFGAKGVSLLRNGASTSILTALRPTAPWVQIEPGANTIRLAVDPPGLPFTLEYQARYGGL